MGGVFHDVGGEIHLDLKNCQSCLERIPMIVLLVSVETSFRENYRLILMGDA